MYRGATLLAQTRYNVLSGAQTQYIVSSLGSNSIQCIEFGQQLDRVTTLLAAARYNVSSLVATQYIVTSWCPFKSGIGAQNVGVGYKKKNCLYNSSY